MAITYNLTVVFNAVIPALQNAKAAGMDCVPTALIFGALMKNLNAAPTAEIRLLLGTRNAMMAI